MCECRFHVELGLYHLNIEQHISHLNNKWFLKTYSLFVGISPFYNV